MAIKSPNTVVARAVESPPNMAELEETFAPACNSEKVTKIPHTVYDKCL